MGLKIAGDLFTGPFPVDSYAIKPNHPPTVYAVVRRGGEPWAPEFHLLYLAATRGQQVDFAQHADRQRWAGGGAGVYLLEMDGASDGELQAAAEKVSAHATARGGRI